MNLFQDEVKKKFVNSKIQYQKEIKKLKHKIKINKSNQIDSKVEQFNTELSAFIFKLQNTNNRINITTHNDRRLHS